MLRLEDAWADMADGLHIQRHFHAVEQARRQRLEEIFRSRHPGEPRSSLESLRSVAPDALLEHLLHPAQEESAETVLKRVRFDSISASLAGCPALVVSAEDCLGDASQPVVDGGRLPSSARRLPPAYARTVAAALDASRLTFIVDLNLGVIVDERASGDYDAFDPSRGMAGTVRLDASLPPLDFAESLSAQLAAQWLYLFLLSRPDPAPPEPRSWPSPWRTEPLESVQMASLILAKSVRHRFRQRLSASSGLVESRQKRDELAQSAARMERELAQMEEFVEGVDEIFRNPARAEQEPYNNLDIEDLLRTFLPGPRQFYKYWGGAGAGQAE